MKFKKFWKYMEIELDINELQYFEQLPMSKSESDGFRLRVFLTNLTGKKPSFVKRSKEPEKEGVE